MSKYDFNEYDFAPSKSAKIDKKKRHRKGFSEDIQEKRAQRVSFKRYVREIEEKYLDEDLEDYVE